jgi:hypothetical protein
MCEFREGGRNMDFVTTWLIALIMAAIFVYIDISIYFINAQDEKWINAKGRLSLKKFFWCIIMPLFPLLGLGLLIAWPLNPYGIRIGQICIEQALILMLSIFILFVSTCIANSSGRM